MQRIGIIGLGFVGGAVREGMKHAFEVYGYDKNDPNIVYHLANGEEVPRRPEGYGHHPIEHIVQEVDGPVFICVPTPMRKDGSCNTEIVESVVAKLDGFSGGLKNKPVAIIKSTIPPGTTASFNDKYKNINIVFNPEFLTERTAIQDFKDMDRIILGGPHSAVSFVKQMYQIAYPNVGVTKTSSTIAEMVKYLTNTFLATKVIFANEMKQICDALDIDYDKVIEYSTKDKRLGPSHWAVPGPDGKLAFGGSCFPKDINGLIARSKEIGIDPKLLKIVWEKNVELRPERDWERLVGRAITE